MSDDFQRYVHINLPHARTIVARLGRSLEAHGAFQGTGSATLTILYERLCLEVQDFDEDPPEADALTMADSVAACAREVVAAILETPARGDRLGQVVRNLFECLALADEGARLSLHCGERADSPLR